MNNNPKIFFFPPLDKNQFLKKYFPVKKFCRAKKFFFSAQGRRTDLSTPIITSV
jgi:hypothetical protein